ncbi:MAG: NAD(P)H-hydrate dehydratase [Microvirga sp.]|jgi:ADP-dependent NAD(P)H-hydrate dehydratase|uniref:ADP-dependent (S)-NAD(P)H-hydrate dehydratase n=1 Tax=Microvirga tunisiensis TaxID=2108360 RepID=A0A5N7MV24_9HYPH|nr:NAD(P)H-hydrate dehydratase [Microvirga tunisiensis]MPR12903.1 NAD(P)H-hydrate dehydratase [Microvirga tunisiensis]MPR30835.1 NAD(P)H-hydrate dehydratase [Microvirga tunisiensis]
MNDGTITSEFLGRIPLSQPAEDGDKDQRGRVLVIAGSASVPGAALLAATAALRAGAGKLQIATCQSIAIHLGLALPEALVVGLPETPSGEIDPSTAVLLRERISRCDAVLIGPGMLDEQGVSALTADLLDCDPGAAFVLDAGALAQLKDIADVLARHKGRMVITPHAGEMANLLGVDKHDVLRNPAEIAGQAASLLHCVVALKGPCTYIATPDGATWTYSDGNVGLATSGSGDTLAGIVAGLLARGVSPLEAAQWGVFLHGEAGNRLAQTRGPLGFLARELLAEIPAIMAKFHKA